MKNSTFKCMLVLMIASTFACGQSVYFSDDFEGQTLGAFGDVSATVGSWHILGVNDTSFVDIVDAGDSHGQVMRVYGAGNSRAWAQFASQTDVITVSYDIQAVDPRANGYGTCYQWIKNTSQGWNQHGTTVSLRKDWSMDHGRIYHGATYTTIPLADYAYQWYNVTITFAAIPDGGVMGDCDVKVIRESNGEVVVDETGVANDGIDLTVFNAFEFTGSGTSVDVYVDNMVVSSERTAVPTFTPDGGSSENSQTIAIACATPNAVIRYTLDGSEPTALSTEYTAPITINRTTMVKAKAWASGYYESTTAPKLFTITNPGTYFLDDLEGQTVGNFDAGGPAMVGSWDQLLPGVDKWVAIEDLGGEHGKVIRYHGTNNYLRAKFATQQGPISVTFDYRAADTTNTGYGYSYTHIGYTGLAWNARGTKIAFTKGWSAAEAKVFYGADYVSMPVLDYAGEWFHVEATFPAVDAGSPLSLCDVRVTRESNGEVIFDETDVANTGSALTAYDVYLFTGGGDFADMYIDNMTVTEVRTAIPAFSLIGGTYVGDQDITLSCSTPGAAIYYTTDGSEPTTSSPLFVAGVPITISMPTTLKAKAFAAGYVDSCVASASYEGPVYGRPAVIAHGSAVIDGDLADWVDADWAPLDQPYDISGSTQAALDADIPEAYYAARWNDTANKVYVAVKVRDTSHSFSMGYGTWNARDAVEIYLHTTGGDPVHYYPSESSAQQYAVGIQTGSTDVVWESLTNLGVMPSNANFLSAGSVVGEWIYYEVAMTPFEFFAGFTGDPDVVDDLDVDDVIGLDVCVVGHDGIDYAGMKSENTMIGKSDDWTQFALHTLEGATQIPGDANGDGSVDVGDLGILAANYGTASGATWALGDFNGDGAVDVGDLGILAANYGTNSSSSDFDADYAKVFGDDASDEETADDSVCALLGLPLIAGLALIGLMLVKLDD